MANCPILILLSFVVLFLTSGSSSQTMYVSAFTKPVILKRPAAIIAARSWQQQRPAFSRQHQSLLFLSSSTTNNNNKNPNDVTTKTAAATATTMESITLNQKRLGRQNLSLDLRTITDHTNVIISHLQARQASEDTIAAVQTIASLTAERTTLIRQRDLALQRRKEYSATVGKLLKQQSQQPPGAGDNVDPIQVELDTVKEQSVQAATEAENAELQLNEIQTTIDTLLASIPNLLDDIVPDGVDEKDNEIVSTWGDSTTRPQVVQDYMITNDDAAATFQPKWHDDVAIGLGGYLQEEAIKMSGTRFIALSGNVAQLERALGMFLMDHATHTNGYTEVSVPYIVSRSTLEGTSQLPKFENDVFAIKSTSHTCNGEDAFLIPTAEVPVTNLHRNCVLEEDQLPLSYVAYTPCFRAEAGSYGRDTKGLIRQHQFHKVELVKITTAETSAEQHELLTQHAESCLQLLELPYRKVRLCSGDIGFAAQHCYDLEVWLPGAQEYREISSCSNTGDFQARRMSLRYKNSKTAKKGSKPKLCHTINGSGLAVGRTLVAILENYQTPNGSVIVPTVLRPYMGGKEILAPPPSTK